MPSVPLFPKPPGMIIPSIPLNMSAVLSGSFSIFSEDEDLQEDYDHYVFLLNEMLDEMKRQDEEAQKALQKTFGRLDQQNSEQNEDLTRR